jgi:hypothetical protein
MKIRNAATAYLLQLNITGEGGQVSFKELHDEKQRSSWLPSSIPSPERIDESSWRIAAVDENTGSSVVRHSSWVTGLHVVVVG